jgi:hypothetical protein
MFEVFQKKMLFQDFGVPLKVVELLLVKLMAEASAAKYVDSLFMLKVLQIKL